MIRLARKFPLLHISLLSFSSEANPVTGIQVQAVYVGGAESTGRNEEVSQGKEGSSEWQGVCWGQVSGCGNNC